MEVNIIDTEREVMKSELLNRIERNLTDYKESFMSFTKQELIEKSDQIHAMNSVHYYMTYSNDLSDEDIDFFLQFQNPVEVLAEGWLDYNRDNNDEIRFALHNIFLFKEDWLESYPLIWDGETAASLSHEPDGNESSKPEKSVQAAAKPKTLADKLQAGKAKSEAYKAQNPQQTTKPKKKEID